MLAETILAIIFGSVGVLTPVHSAQAVTLPPLQATPQEIVIQTAKDYDIATSTLYNLAFSESSFNPNKENKQGDRGLFQISRKYHPEVSDECAFDPNCAAQWTAGRIIDGYLYEWTSANCYSYVSLFVHVPLMNKIIPNSPPKVGSVAIFNYHGTPHVAYVSEVQEKGIMIKEANFKPAVIDTRFIDWTDPYLKGFWSPSASP